MLSIDKIFISYSKKPLELRFSKDEKYLGIFEKDSTSLHVNPSLPDPVLYLILHSLNDYHPELLKFLLSYTQYYSSHPEDKVQILRVDDAFIENIKTNLNHALQIKRFLNVPSPDHILNQNLEMFHQLLSDWFKYAEHFIKQGYQLYVEFYLN